MQTNEKCIRVGFGNGQVTEEIDLIELFYHLVDKLNQIIIVGVIFAVVTCGWNLLFVAPTYEATAKLYVVGSGVSSIVNLSDLQIGSSLAKDYKEVFRNTDLHNKVRQKLQFNYTDEELDRMISITVPTDTRILEISVKAKNEREAKDIVAAYQDEAILFIEDVMDTKTPTVFQQPTSKGMVSRGTVQKTIIAFLVGAIIVIGIHSVIFVLDDRITTSDIIEKHVGITTLGMMPDLDSPELTGGKGSFKLFQRKKKK